MKKIYDFLKVITRARLFFFLIISLIIGMSFIGLGLGLYFRQTLGMKVGLLLGYGAGLVITSIAAFKVMKYILIYNKENL